MAREQVDPKSAGMGAEVLSSVDVVVKSHDAVREVLLALETVASANGNGSDALDDFRSKAQLARRALETLEAELAALKSNLTAGSAPTTSTTASATAAGNRASAQHVHVHLHLELSQSNGQIRVVQ
jgi:hypothetical protein